MNGPLTNSDWWKWREHGAGERQRWEDIWGRPVKYIFSIWQNEDVWINCFITRNGDGDKLKRLRHWQSHYVCFLPLLFFSKRATSLSSSGSLASFIYRQIKPHFWKRFTVGAQLQNFPRVIFLKHVHFKCVNQKQLYRTDVTSGLQEHMHAYRAQNE